MPTNVEIKARVRDFETVRKVATNLATRERIDLDQVDVFFRSEKGRLKLRTFANGTGELIRYQRADTEGAKQSNYEIYETENPGLLRQVLSEALGELVVVTKKREVYIARETRIHLDQVEGLGNFVELEVVLGPHLSQEEGVQRANELMEAIGIQETDLVARAYADLILDGGERVG